MSGILNTKVFSGDSHCIVIWKGCRGQHPDLPSQRIQVLKRQILKHGGEISTELNDQVDVVVVSAFCSEDEARKILNERRGAAGPRIVCPDWVSTSIIQGRPSSDEKFVVDLEKIANSRCVQLSGEQMEKLSEIRGFGGSSELEEVGNLQGNLTRKGAVRRRDQHAENSELGDNASKIRKLSRISEESDDGLEESANDEHAQNVSKDSKFEFQAESSGQISESRNDVNFQISANLEKLGAIYRDIQDRWREHAYNKAAAVVRSYPKPLNSMEELHCMRRTARGIGNAIFDKIQEMINDGFCRRLEDLENSEQVKVLELFNSVWGSGPSTSLNWYRSGWRTLDDVLLHGSDKISKAQKVGIKYFKDFQQKIPKSEVQIIVDIVSNAVFENLGPESQVICCGSFRRGKPGCGDVDILISHPDSAKLDGYLPQLICNLHSPKFSLLVEDLASASSQRKSSVQTYMGVCKISQSPWHRRIDIKTYPKSMLPFAMLYFTGSANFNRAIRLHAKQRGFELTDKALKLKGPHGEPKISVPCTSEEEIFSALGLEYQSPDRREGPHVTPERGEGGG